MLTVPQEIKDLLHQDTCPKNIRIHFPNMERTDICNNLIVKDSVSFKESLCSQDTLKFGLCESPVFECEVVGVENIKGMTIQVFCEVYCDATVEDAEWKVDIQQYVYSIPYGTFVVNEATRQADMQHRKIIAFGGTANININNEIILYKSKVQWSSAVDYSPNIFKTMMELGESTHRLDEVTYSEVTAQNLDVMYVQQNSWISETYYLYCTCKVYKITSANENNLFYFEANKPTKSLDEILNDLLAGQAMFGAGKSLSSQIREMTVFGPGISSGSQVSQVYATQKGSYVYPYQIAESYSDESFGAKYIIMPYKMSYRKSSIGQFIPTIITECQFRDPSSVKIYNCTYSAYPSVTFTVEREFIPGTGFNPDGYSFDNEKIDYLALFDKVLELSGIFGQIDRDNMFKLINIQERFGLNPSGTLFPGENNYPQGPVGGTIYPEDYQKCWYDDDYIKPFGAVQCSYKNQNNIDSIFIEYLPGFSADSPLNSYQTYYLDNNTIINNSTWTQAQIKAMCDVIASNIEGVTYMPVDFVGRGLPYVEAGDTFEIFTRSNDSITTIVLNRTISGEQMLTDTYKSV